MYRVMVTKEYDMDVNVVNALKSEISEKDLPVQLQTGFPFTSENGNQMMHVQMDCSDEYADELGELISQIINRIYCLT